MNNLPFSSVDKPKNCIYLKPFLAISGKEHKGSHMYCVQEIIINGGNKTVWEKEDIPK